MDISDFGHLRHRAKANAILDVTIQLKQDLVQQGIAGLSKSKDSKSHRLGSLLSFVLKSQQSTKTQTQDDFQDRIKLMEIFR